jgi:anhydro-N-acetylmuramic acid kinase
MKRSMIVAGVMSGTSADGIDVAVVRITQGKVWAPKIKLLAHEAFPYPAALRRKVLAAMNAQSISTAELARLNWRLGLAYAEAVYATARKHRLKLNLVGCHGQTLYHQAREESYAGQAFACTWQLGEPAVIAGVVGAPVVSNFRPADMAVGGQGAPLVPMLDYLLFNHAKRARVLQNIGGIANLTAIFVGKNVADVVAFDTGPGNMVIDALMQELFNRKYDRNGAVSARGAVLTQVLEWALKDKYFEQKPPRTTGREQYGREYAARFLRECRKHSRNPADAISTATALTAESIAESYVRFVRGKMKGAPVDYIISGGGAHNATLMAMLTRRLQPMGCRVRTIDEFGMPAAAKEAAAFALMAWMTWHGLPGNVPSATGAKRPAILGQISFPPCHSSLQRS